MELYQGLKAIARKILDIPQKLWVEERELFLACRGSADHPKGPRGTLKELQYAVSHGVVPEVGDSEEPLR